MKLAMLGLGRMGGNMTRRLVRAGHSCVVYDAQPQAAAALAAEGAVALDRIANLRSALAPPRVVWLMVPAEHVDALIAETRVHLEPGDIVIDGGNSNFRDTIRRADELRAAGLHFVDVGTSGGIWGLEQGFCLMLGGDAAVIAWLEPIFQALAPGAQAAAPTPGHAVSAAVEQGYLHCGPSGAGHFVKMVHNGIEYGLMAAYAEGMNLLQSARSERLPRAENSTTPVLDPALSLADVAEVWRRGSVVRSWLLDLAARALLADRDLSSFTGHVADSGEGRWTVKAGVDAAVPLPVLSAALFARYSSRGESAFADKVLSALRSEFGGHREPSAGKP
jgi:6-phosphogluconate dehydrogenase